MDQKAHFLSKALNPSPLLLPLPSSSLGFYPPPSRRNATPPPPLAAAVAVGGALPPSPSPPARAAMAAGKSSSASKEDQYAALRELYRPHIDSFDYFIDEGLDKMLQSIRPVEITVPNSPTTLRNILPAFFFFFLPFARRLQFSGPVFCVLVRIYQFFPTQHPKFNSYVLRIYLKTALVLSELSWQVVNKANTQ